MSWIEAFTDAREVNQLMVRIAGKLAFDIGANGGYVAKLLTRTFDQVVAVEPAIESYEHLIPRCPIDNLTCLNMAVSDHIGQVELGIKSWTESHGELFTGDSLELWGPDSGRRTVPCTTLDHLAKTYGFPDFVKIDTEGHEAKIIDGAHDVFYQAPRFSIEIHSIENGEHVKVFLAKHHLDYTIVHHSEYTPGSDYDLNHYWLVRE